MASLLGSERNLRTSLPLKARVNIRNEWDAKSSDLREDIGRLVGSPGIQFVVDFAQIAEELKKPTRSESELDIEVDLARIGSSVLLYFVGLRDYLKGVGFEGDDMLQGGFQEAVATNMVGLRIVEKLETKLQGWNEAVIHDGVLWLQCQARAWGTRTSQVADGVMKLL